MARYTPSLPAGEDLNTFLLRELAKIAQAMETQDEQFNLKMLYAAPKKYRAGTIVYADGTTWNPGSGQGIYCYNGTTWKFLG